MAPKVASLADGPAKTPAISPAHPLGFEPRTFGLVRKVISDARYARGIQLLEGVVAMLTKMF